MPTAFLADEVWRERMGIEPTRSLFPDPSPVLKTGPGTSRGHAPRSVCKSQNTTVNVGFPFFQGGISAGHLVMVIRYARERKPPITAKAT